MHLTLEKYNILLASVVEVVMVESCSKTEKLELETGNQDSRLFCCGGVYPSLFRHLPGYLKETA